MNIVVNLNKKRDITSHDAVTAVKKAFKVRKAGHAGTLDPIATGVLLVCLNEATKITGFLSDLDKEYIMTARLGESTDSYDSEGVVTERADYRAVTRVDIDKALPKFIGEIEQIPPMHSAIKISGTPLYELARKGIEVERKPRKVAISSIEVLGFEPPLLTLRVACSKGTYIRSLCNDLGAMLGVGAHVTGLVRTRIGDFTLENAADIGELPLKPVSLHSIDSALNHLPEVVLAAGEYRRARNGNPVPSAWACDLQSSFIRLKDPEGRLFGIGKKGPDSIKIERLFNI